ncbi:calcium-dependent protein kinase 29-like [Phalaenopsis equestris]|uniref:calcium-dependent protein kinase 29-like n=1 Tax=Phalaenopsis equestris TaxID=78828 RepID=UPI0009E4B9A8|nr:calcium-dependent protein kinase 29-like [Phalaenopsis equestris]XP_020571970.1 calcium-dependent protein kinase 29-like [Phalaenopsis equestris]XP_020571971.1 calcium-dependent protein kinase 29-like [Phalaenopsis equestris]
MANGGANLRCNCYKVPGLSIPILETSSISYLGDRYVLGEQLGWGQFGVIRSCSDLVTGEILACKSIAKDRVISADDVRNVKLEIEIMMRLSGHPNVVDLKAVYEEADYVHLVMELCAGGELFHRLEKHGCFAEREAAVLFRELMEVVMYCHENGIVHRDLKPENILLATNSSSSPIKLADFGLATYIKPGQRLSWTVGSPFYIAPEVLAGGYNQAADVWSAGVILYILLSGMPPFWGKTKSRIFNAVRSAELLFPSDPWDEVSDSAKELVTGMLCRDSNQRFTAKQVVEHSWIKDYAQKLQGVNVNRILTNFEREDSSSSFSAPIMLATRDLSFSFIPPVNVESQSAPSSPTFCLTPCSPFHGNSTPPPIIGFSFHSCSHSNSMEFSPSAPLTLNFSFLSPPPIDFTANELIANTIQRGSISCKLLESVLYKEAELSNTSRAISRRSKRNRTIGMGEFEQLNLVVSESVIRWASCTPLKGAMSLRSSLVC